MSSTLADSAFDASTPRTWRTRSVTDWLFMAVPTTAAIGSAFGSTMVAGISLYPFKVLTLVLTCVAMSQHRRVPRAAVPIVVLSLCLASWALITVLWSTAGPAALQEATIFVFLVALLLLCFTSIGTNWFASFIVGWPLAVFFTSVVALGELLTGNHLKNDFVSNTSFVGDVILSTFANPNNYGAFLALAMAVCLTGSTMTSMFGRGTRRFMFAAIGTALVMLPLTASRFAVLGVVAGTLTFAVLGLRSRRGQRFVLALVVLSVPAGLVLLRASPKLVEKFSAIAAQRTGTGNSTSIRENLIANGWDFFIETRGLGVGAAGYEPRILSGDFTHPLFGRASNPHNLWIELLSEYGLVGIAAVGLILMLSLRAAAPLRHPTRFGASYIAMFMTYLIAAMTASSYVNDTVSWTFFSTFVALGVWIDHTRRRAEI